MPARWQAPNVATFNEKHHPSYVEAYAARTRYYNSTNAIWPYLTLYPLLCLLLKCYLHLPFLVIPFLVLSLYYFTLLTCLLKTHTAFANNSKSSRIICSYTLPRILLYSYFLQSIFTFERSWLHRLLKSCIYFFSLINPNNLNSRVRSFVYTNTVQRMEHNIRTFLK